MRPKSDGILETSLYVSDVSRSIRFYQDTFGFSVISDFGQRGCAMQAGTQQVLLLFKKGASRAIASPHTSRSQSHPVNCPTGSRGLSRAASPWRRSVRGNWVAAAFTFVTLTAICSSLPRPARGRFTRRSCTCKP